MPLELLEERIIANVKTALEAIKAGSTYHYTPTVVRADQFSGAVLQPTKPIIVAIRDSSESVPDPANRQFGKDARVLPVFILLAHYDEASDNDPFSRTLARGTIRHRRIRDTMIALNADPSRGGLALSQDITDINKDFEEGAGAWILAELVLEVGFEFNYSAP